MKEVIFKKVSMQNFLSFGKRQEIEFRDGVTAILSTNRDKDMDSNGCGKSTICSAVAFALFGTAIKDMKKEEVVNRLAKKNCVVELEFSVVDCGIRSEYVVSRGVAPSFCRVSKNGEDVTLSGIPATNDYIADLISTTERMFLNTVMMNSEQPPFMRQRKNEKREFIEGVFSLQFIKEMNKIVKSEADEVSLKYGTVGGQIEAKKSLLETYRENSKQDRDRVDRELDVNESHRRELLEEIGKLKAEAIMDLKDLQNRLDECQTLSDDVSRRSKEAEARRDKFKSDYISENTKLKGLKESLSKHQEYMEESSRIKNRISVNCKAELDMDIEDVCAMDIESVELDIESKQKEIQERRSSIDKCESEILHTSKEIGRLKGLGNVCDKCGRPFDGVDMDERKKTISSLEKEVSDNLTRIESNKKDINDLTTRMSESKKFLSVARKMIGDIRQYEARPSYDIDAEQAEVERCSKVVDAMKPQINVLLEEKVSLEKESADAQLSLLSIKREIDADKYRTMNIKTIEGQIEYIDDKIRDLKNSPDAYKSKIEDLESELSRMSSEYDELGRKLEVYRLVREVLSDDGFRAYMIRQYVTALISGIIKYLVKFGAPMEIKFDEYFEDTIRDNMTGDECSYASLSGGEKRRLDLATLLALVDMREMQGVVKFNELFFDEVFDSALSAGACGKLMEMLVERKESLGENSILITHKVEMQTDENIDNVLMVEKLGGVSSAKYVSRT